MKETNRLIPNSEDQQGDWSSRSTYSIDCNGEFALVANLCRCQSRRLLRWEAGQGQIAAQFWSTASNKPSNSRAQSPAISIQESSGRWYKLGGPAVRFFSTGHSKRGRCGVRGFSFQIKRRTFSKLWNLFASKSLDSVAIAVSIMGEGMGRGVPQLIVFDRQRLEFDPITIETG